MTEEPEGFTTQFALNNHDREVALLDQSMRLFGFEMSMNSYRYAMAGFQTILWGLIAALIFFGADMGQILPDAKFWLLVGIGYFWLIAITYWIKRFPGSALRALKDNVKNNSEAEYQVGSFGLRQISHESDLSLRWAAFYKWSETQLHFILHRNNGSKIVMPKRSMKSIQIDILRKYCETNIGAQVE